MHNADRHSLPEEAGSRRNLLSMLGGIAAAGIAGPALAHPQGPVRIVVGFPAGGFLDAIARVISVKLQDVLKRTVLVENRPGAGSRLAANLFKNMPADGNHHY